MALTGFCIWTLHIVFSTYKSIWNNILNFILINIQINGTFELFREAGVWECFRYRFSHTNGFCFFTFIGRGHLLLQPLLLLLLPLVEPEGLLHGQEEISPLLTTFLPQALLFMDDVIIKRLWDVLRDGSDTKLFLTLGQVCLLFGFLWILRERLPMSLCHCSQIIRSSSSWCLDYIWGKIPQDHLWTEDKIGRRYVSVRDIYENIVIKCKIWITCDVCGSQ